MRLYSILMLIMLMGLPVYEAIKYRNRYKRRAEKDTSISAFLKYLTGPDYLHIHKGVSIGQTLTPKRKIRSKRKKLRIYSVR